ncbi:MAG TPA: CHRD domain-containing protein [Vicinamibacteria bacterium]|nr:CHRD domain-containing protein [Vicinamibacteria bacterium]
MRRITSLAIALTAAVSAFGCGNDRDDREYFQAVLSGAEEVPARATAANGIATFYLEGDAIRYSLTFDDIQNVTAAHIHTAAAGVNGPVRAFLFAAPTGTTVSTGDQRILNQGAIVRDSVTGITWDEFLAALRSGGAYVNVHTTQFPGGEMRGQIRRID